jgi:sphingomyelin phosphodiesterase
MRLFGILARVGLFLALPVLSQALTAGDVTRDALQGLAKRDLVSDVVADIKNAATCSACEVGRAVSCHVNTQHFQLTR